MQIFIAPSLILIDKHVQMLGAPIELMGCFAVYPPICWVFSENMNVG
jgi:hypothetical protein